ncbi:2-hydroxyacid dehydrogenase [Aestuariibacter sp. A3R04]|uniref:2-hydroxyacid dehydrogenase n=1 Tax=Aestuariibacter sp. A3R04 TaxID=2841571 RepID=UPI001C0A0512|nr:2-hydroxyacid dehydrogenase [Aestuariibacter sp. A3R04]
MKLGVFSAQPYEEKAISAEADDTLEIQYFPVALNTKTVSLCDNLDVICVFVNDDVNADVIAKLAESGVYHIALRCAGYNNVDLDAAKRLGVAVSHVPAYGPEAVAEHAVALMLTLNRKMHKAYNRVKDGNFNLNGLLGFNMAGKTVGIIGTGHIGRATARILMGFGCHVLCVDPYPDKLLQKSGARYTDLDTLLSQSDIISLHCPLNKDSYHLINDETINKMKNGVMLINTSRGGLTDTHALINGLKSHKIGYLGLDVYEMESELFFKDHSCEIIQDDIFERLATFHNVLITGHQGFFTQEALSQISSTTLSNISAWHNDEATTNSFLVLPPKAVPS